MALTRSWGGFRCIRGSEGTENNACVKISITLLNRERHCKSQETPKSHTYCFHAMDHILYGICINCIKRTGKSTAHCFQIACAVPYLYHSKTAHVQDAGAAREVLHVESGIPNTQGEQGE